MTQYWWLVFPVAVGHCALLVGVMNVAHSFGITERRIKWVDRALIAVFVLAASALAATVVYETGSVWAWPIHAYGAVCLVTALVFLPLATAQLHLRATPVGIEARERIVDLAAVVGRDALTGRGKYAWLLRLPGNESFRLRVAECDVPIAGLPTALDGLSILHLSDLHLARCFDRRFFDEVFTQAQAQSADIVAFTGDLLDDDGAAEWIAPLCARVRGRLGSYAILGNHDLEHDPRRLGTLLGAAGFIDLEGAWATLEIGDATIALGGTSFPWGPPLDRASRPSAALSILLSHTPDLFYRAERDGFDLMLSGHNHGGQIRVPLIGPIFMPSRYSRRFDRGFFRRDKLTLHVSQGIAAKHPVRYGCLPEISRLVLRAVPTPGRHAGATAESSSYAHT